MPVIKSAKKKLRQDKKRQLENKKIKNAFKAVLKDVRENPSAKVVEKAFSSLDKAAKKGIIHKNKAARLKSAVSKLLKTKTPKKEVSPTSTAPKKPPKKTSVKK